MDAEMDGTHSMRHRPLVAPRRGTPSFILAVVLSTIGLALMSLPSDAQMGAPITSQAGTGALASFRTPIRGIPTQMREGSLSRFRLSQPCGARKLRVSGQKESKMKGSKTAAKAVVAGANGGVPGVGGVGTEPVTDTATLQGQIISSPNDPREYRLTTLNNGLKVMLVSDEDADNAAGAIGVNCGSWCDPKEVPGLAHFLEHMLFLGTKKFPSENEFSSYLNQHGGHCNAFTASETTVFYFDVDNDYLKGSLDRFAQFFINPLFNPSATGREINAIDSEHKQYLQSDFNRMYEVYKSLGNREHPFSQFATGDKTTLLRDDIRDYLTNFYKKHYSANQMRLCIVGKESLDELESWAKEIFREVPNTGVEKPKFPISSPVWPQDSRGIQVEILPIADEHSLMLTWPVDMKFKDIYRENPQGYLSYVLSSEAPGGLVSDLKEKEWIAGLAGRVFQQSEDINVFSVAIDLTDKGINKIDDVVKEVFEYLNLIKTKGIKKDLWSELIGLAEVDFRFTEKDTPGHTASSSASRLLNDLPPEDTLLPPSRALWNPEYIKNLIDELTPEKMTMFVESKRPFQEPKEVSGKVEEIEPWYGTQYTKAPFSTEQLNKWTHAKATSSKLQLPSKNPFVPTDFTLVRDPLPLKERQKYASDEKGLWSPPSPRLTENTTQLTLWHSSDAIKEFPVPRVQAYAVMRTEFSQKSAKNQALTDIYLDMVGDYLAEKLYEAGIAGYSFSFGSSDNGFSVAMQGYSQGANKFLEEALQLVRNPPLSPLRFESIKEESLRAYDNFFKSQPYDQAQYILGRVCNPDGFGVLELQEALKSITLKDVKTFVPTLLDTKWSLESLVHGNIEEKDAKDLASLFRKVLQGGSAKAIPSTPDQQRYQLDLGEGKSYAVRGKLANPLEKNSATFVRFQLGDRRELSTKDLATCLVLGSMIQEPAYDELRTKQQLGYIVSAGSGVTLNVFTLMFLVQGAEHSAEYYDGQIEQFARTFEKKLQDMSDTELEGFKSSIESALLKKDLTISDRAIRFWDPITKQLYKFDWSIDRVLALRSLTKSDILDFYRSKVLDPSTRRRVSVRMESEFEKERNNLEIAPVQVDQVFDDVVDLRSILKPFGATNV
ncbi:hypothetical protein AAMO2058_000064300 [Amorphochlora amoebiformis]